MARKPLGQIFKKQGGWTAAAAAVGIYSSYKSAKEQKKAAGKAADAAQEGTEMSVEAQMEMQQKAIDAQMAMQANALAELRAGRMQADARLSPYSKGGMTGFNAMMDLLAEGPDYELTRAEGFREIQNSAAAAGLLSSGGTLAELVKYNHMLNETAWQQKANLAGNIAQIGGNAAAGQATNFLNSARSAASLFGSTGNNLANMYMQTGSNLANLYTNQANVMGNAALASGQASANMWSGLGNVVGGAFGNWNPSFSFGGSSTPASTGFTVPGSGGQSPQQFYSNSDARLKTNVEKIGEHDGINIYRWEWNDEAKAMGIDDPTIGVMAHEVPDEYVVEKDGYLMVDYGRLFGEAA